MKNRLALTIVFSILANISWAQSGLQNAAYQFSLISELKDYQIKIIDISEETQLIFNQNSLSFEEFENNIIETKNGYTFFNEENIDFYFIGFYKKHDILWDTYETVFIMNLPENLKGSCDELPVSNNMLNVAAAYLGKEKLERMTLEECKSQVLLYYSKAFESDCKEVSLDDLLNLLEFSAMPLNGLKLEDSGKKN